MYKCSKLVAVLFTLVFGLLAFCSKAIAAETPSQLYFPNINTVMGNPHGRITVVEFFDYRCGYCRQMPRIFAELINSNPEVRIVFRDYPSLGPASQFAAQAALAAAFQGRYLQMHNALFATGGPLDDTSVMDIARSIGLNTRKLTQDMSSPRVLRQLQNTAYLAQRVGVYGIPTVVVALTHQAESAGAVHAYVVTSPSLGDLQGIINRLSREG